MSTIYIIGQNHCHRDNKMWHKVAHTRVLYRLHTSGSPCGHEDCILSSSVISFPINPCVSLSAGGIFLLRLLTWQFFLWEPTQWRSDTGEKKEVICDISAVLCWTRSCVQGLGQTWLSKGFSEVFSSSVLEVLQFQQIHFETEFIMHFSGSVC